MLQPIFLAPGIDKSQSQYADQQPFAFAAGASAAERIARGRWIDGQWIRFLAEFPEKIGGYTTSLAMGSIVGVPRAQMVWRASTAVEPSDPYMAIGTDSHLYIWDDDETTLTDITPFRTLSSGTLSSPFTTTANTTTVAVADSSQVLKNGDPVYLSGASAVGGITISGWFIVSSRSGTGYDIVVPVAPSSSTSGGGTTQFSYPRINLTNPFTTTNLSNVVTVAHTAHGAATGDYVAYSGASAVGGITPNGEYQLTVVNANSYTITTASAATSGATGGGTVSTTYDISFQTSVSGGFVVYGDNGAVYGEGAYGSSLLTAVADWPGWTLAPYGYLLMGAPVDGTIYVYDPTQGGRAYPLLNAPTNIHAMFVTPERFVIALGTSNSSMQLAWPDQSDPTNWTSLPTNTANSGRNLVGGGSFVGGIGVRDGVSLIFSDTSVFQMTYTGDNEVYSTPLAGDNCGLVGPNAGCAMAEVAYWMGDSEFWTWNGVVSALPSDDIRDYVFRNLNYSQRQKCHAGTVRKKKEVWFFYPSGENTECDSYVIYHVDQNCWSVGTIPLGGTRTSFVDASLLEYPFGCDASGVLYQHETGTDAAGNAIDSWVTTAPVDLSNGNMNLDFLGFIPDFERQSGDASLTVMTRYYPSDPQSLNGPFTISATDGTPRIDLRDDGKMAAFEIESNVLGGDFRVGLNRIDIQPSGARL
jgi:hypothetical protein